jgi:exodeoxyribonuclease X
MRLIVLDTETSDLPENGGKMIELAWVALQSPDWKPISSYEHYIQYNGPLSPKAQAQNHIEPIMLTETNGAVKREDAVADLLHAIEPDTILVAHNVAFDRQFLPELTRPWLCTFRASKHIWPEAPGHSNQVLRYWLGVKPDLSIAADIKVRMPHQALYDVATTTGILQLMLKQHSPEHLQLIAGKPARLKSMTFGKHKGKSFHDIPCDYLVWLRKQTNLDEDVRYTIDSVLSGQQ